MASGKGGGGGGTLADQMRALGLVSAKQAKQVEHGRRVEHHEKGRVAVEAEKAAREARVAAQAEARRQEDRQRELARQRQVEAREAAGRLRQIVEGGRVKLRSGPRRWYYETRADQVLYLELHEEHHAMLDRGELVLIQEIEGAVSLVPAEVEVRLLEIDPDAIRSGPRAARLKR